LARQNRRLRPFAGLSPDNTRKKAAKKKGRREEPAFS